MYFWRQQLTAAELPGGTTPREPGRATNEPPAVDWGFTAREGGHSHGPFGSLNLALHVGDETDAVLANRAALARSLDVAPDHLVFTGPDHGARVAVVDEGWDPAGQAAPADAVVTSRQDVALATLVADCVPVLLSDRVAGLVAAVHAGRPGLTAGVVERTVDVVLDLGARDLHALIGPSVCGRCYEVPDDLRATVASRYPVAAATSWQGTPALDLAAAAVETLHRRGVTVTWLAGCTRESPRLYSYRRSRLTGRFAGVVRLRSDL